MKRAQRLEGASSSTLPGGKSIPAGGQESAALAGGQVTGSGKVTGSGQVGSGQVTGDGVAPLRIQLAAEWVIGRLFGVEGVHGLRASGYEWLVGQPTELPIPDYASLAQRAGTGGASVAAAPAGAPQRPLRAVSWPNEPAPPPPTLQEELRRFAPVAVRTLGVALVAALLWWGVGSADIWRTGSNAAPVAALVAAPQQPADRSFTADALLPARAVTPAPVVVSRRAAELAVVNPANQLDAATPAPQLPDTAQAAPVAAAAAVQGGGALQGGGAAAQSSIGGTAQPVWPFSIEIVTPTPNSEAERRLFAEPLVAQQESEGAALALNTGDLQQPVLIRALAAEANGGQSVAAPSLKDLAQPRILPAIVFAPVLGVSTPQPEVPPEPTLAPIVLEPGRAWSTFISDSESTHFWVGRPHPASVENQIAAPSYQFGSTAGGRYRPHHGMDIANSSGTPVRAATTGTVVHAGLDDPNVLGPYPNFYGNAVVILLDRRLIVAGGEMDVYLLYGHLSEVTVEQGQRVQPDDIVGRVGMTGIAIGPHLHVEMRVGANTYEASVNPYLWVEPPPGHGAVAARLLTADGRTWPTARLTLARFSGNVASWARVMEVYPDNESINPDPAWGENTAMEAVPAGTYVVVGAVNGERVAAEVTVEAGKTSFVELRTTK